MNVKTTIITIAILCMLVIEICTMIEKPSKSRITNESNIINNIISNSERFTSDYYKDGIVVVTDTETGYQYITKSDSKCSYELLQTNKSEGE